LPPGTVFRILKGLEKEGKVARENVDTAKEVWYLL
jgi:uncharacterized membrane protein